MSWRSLLDGDLRRRTIAAIHDIAVAVGNGGAVHGGLEGAGGHACLLAYVGQVEGDEEALARGSALLDASVAALNDGPRAPGMWGGLADVRFLVAHLAGGDEADDALRVIDDALIAAVGGDAGDRIDLIGGLAGIGLAALEGGGGAAALAARVLDVLEARASRDDAGTTWFTAPHLLPDWQRAICPDGHWNLGLAHGIPGVIGFLAAAISADVEATRARALLDGAVPWLLAAAPPRTPARFPAWCGPGASAEPARLAWCYGDPGVAITLLAAARATGNAGWEAEAVALARGMAARAFESSGVLDMGICHGAAGVAHIFNRMYQATGDDLVGDAARAWVERLLAMRRPGEAVAGFPARSHVDGADAWVADAGVLMGAAGVGLVLLAATSEVEPAWDRALACDVRPRVAA